jgi:hypothetical protein
MDNLLESLQYPIGRFTWSTDVSESQVRDAIQTMEQFPEKIYNAVKKLDEEQLNTPYRPEGWTVRQVVHHCADSHMNAYIRFKLALTETAPVIKPYDEALWASLPDSKKLHPSISLSLIEILHERWVFVMRNMSSQDWDRVYVHPEHGKTFSLKSAALMYAWHSQHHVAHITSLAERMGWE